MAVVAILSHTFQAFVHKDMSSIDELSGSKYGGDKGVVGVLLPSARLIISSVGATMSCTRGFLAPNMSRYSSVLVSMPLCLIRRISWKLLRAASETSAFRQRA